MIFINSPCLFSVTLLIFAFYDVSGEEQTGGQLDDMNLPLSSDLETYILSLDNLVKFYIKNPNEIDVNTVFGFFLMNVNLNSVKNKTKYIPPTLAEKFENITQKNKRLVAYFRMMAAQSQIQISEHMKLKKIATLFSNESLWVSHTKHSDKSQLPDLPPIDFRQINLLFSSWPEYKEEINNGKMLPTNSLTDKCLVIIAENPVYFGNSTVPRCVIPQECITGIGVGNDIGFGLTNRLVMLIQARFGRRCSIISEEQDIKLVDELCTKSYKEALFISMNRYDPLILMLEMVTLCSLNGNVEFLRRPWLSYILDLQTLDGCFSQTKADKMKRSQPNVVAPRQWSLVKGNQPQPGSPCFGPIAAAAAAILSAAVKYIIEFYY